MILPDIEDAEFEEQYYESRHEYHEAQEAYEAAMGMEFEESRGE